MFYAVLYGAETMSSQRKREEWRELAANRENAGCQRGERREFEEGRERKV
jgi:hypothetical protein